MDEIWVSAKDGKIAVQPVFTIVDRAKEILTGCEEKAAELQLVETVNVLENECCQALSPHISREIYKINQSWKPKE